MVRIRKIADKLGLDPVFVRDVLFELTTKADRETKDRIFQAARDMGYDITKLSISKKMATRKEMIDEIIKNVKANQEWGREDILEFLEYTRALVDRVHKKVLPEEEENS